MPLPPSSPLMDEASGPRRLLIVSGSMGEGHNAMARALREAAAELWPEVLVDHVDVLDVLGPGIGPLFRSIYSGNVGRAPWLYQLYFDSVLHRSWFIAGTKGFTGGWAGRRLARRVAEVRPDIVLSTYPMGSAGLEWLHRRGRLDARTACWVGDFAPHPLWIYAGLDLNVVADDGAVARASEQVPGARVVAGGPPVERSMRPRPRSGARARLGLPPDAFVAVVSCGSLGFGDVARAGVALLDASPRMLVLVVCGRNERLRRRLRATHGDTGRLRPLGWTDDVPGLLAASDVVVTNAGGSTAMEAVACGRALLMHRPIAGHGRENACLLEQVGLAETCWDEHQLTEAARRLLEHPDEQARRERRAVETARRHTLTDALRRLLPVTGSAVA